jgi:hypothetical protein
MIRTQKLFSLLILACASIAGYAQTINGTWVFERAVDYEALDTKVRPPSVTTIQISNNQLSLPPKCLVPLSKENYYPGGPFQALLKSGEPEQAINAFLLKEFSFKLQDASLYYQANQKMAYCNQLASEFLINNEKLLAIRAGSLFYSFTRTKLGAAPEIANAAKSAASPLLLGLKPSQLPFNASSYMGLCATLIETVRGIPQSTAKCAPAYHPYVASRQSKDELSRLVGSHNYQKGGAENESGDYNNPVANNLHPVFLVFPPLKSVILIRVDDMENANDRDPIRGAYISTKNGKIIDQLNESCAFDTNFVCRNENTNSGYRLLETGQFEKMARLP